jgi:hypothetical protein
MRFDQEASMFFGQRLVVPAALAMTVLVGACGSSDAAVSSGVGGSVTVAPVVPGGQRPGDPGSGPYAGADVQLLAPAGTLVNRASTEANGQFLILAPAGRYVLHVDTRGAPYPRCPDQGVQVTEGQVAQVTIACDSGIR